MYTDELFELYKRYEKAIHSKDRESSFCKTHICNSPVYHPEYDTEFAYNHSKIE
jgi:hypothetical protein